MRSEEFLQEVCQPSVEELVADPTSFRRAWVAVTSLFHFADYVALERDTRLESVHREFADEFTDFSLVRDVANASKHAELARGPRKGLSAAHIDIGYGAAFSDGSYYSDGTSHSDASDVVRVVFHDEQIDLVNLCERCLHYLKAKC
ncbi:MAG: hypothetical protein BGN99_03435 [Alphaproteobacteria bacterium 65-37]|nr:MAG: hypothetical protein BGN99_03435 [Alphaproteobacteria bacterium 65-37]